jgi:hypothetical protein
VIHSDDLFAPVGYMEIDRFHLEDKETEVKTETETETETEAEITVER